MELTPIKGIYPKFPAYRKDGKLSCPNCHDSAWVGKNEFGCDNKDIKCATNGCGLEFRHLSYDDKIMCYHLEAFEAALNNTVRLNAKKGYYFNYEVHLKSGLPYCPICNESDWNFGAIGGLSQNICCKKCSTEWNYTKSFPLEPINKTLEIVKEKFLSSMISRNVSAIRKSLASM